MRAPLHRRGFLKIVGGAAFAGAGGLVTASPAFAGTDGAAGHSGHHRIPVEHVSIQLYTLRNVLSQDLEGTLAALSAIGYRRVELAGTYGRTAQEFRRILDRHGLEATSSHVGLDAVRGDWAKALEDALTLGQRYIVCPWVPDRTADGFRRLAEDFNRAGALARQVGLKFGYHNHDFEFRIVDGGTRLYDVLLAECDPHLVHFELDLYWAVAGGVDPVQYLVRHPGRFRQFHVKDMARDGSWADLGTGIIDFPRIFRYARRAGIREYIVEHDNPPSPVDTARVGFEYLRHVRF